MTVERRDLAFRGPYDWRALIGFLALRAITGVEVVSADAYARTIALGPAQGLLAVTPSAKPDRIAVEVRFRGPSATPLILDRVRRIFDLDADPKAIGAHLSRDPDLASHVAARPGLRVPGAWDGFELAVRAILGQQISVAAATRLAARIVRDWGEPLPPDLAGVIPGLTHTFPTPERLADAELSVLPMPRARSAALQALARAVADDPTRLDRRRDPAEAIARLKSLAGVGDWTAHYIAMRHLRDADAFPRGDIGLMRALAGPDGTRPTAAALQARAEAWRPWRAYAALHLWTADPLAPKARPIKAPAKDPDDRQAA